MSDRPRPAEAERDIRLRPQTAGRPGWELAHQGGAGLRSTRSGVRPVSPRSRPLTTYHLDDLGLPTRLLLHGEDVLGEHHPGDQGAHAGAGHRSHLRHGGPVHGSSPGQAKAPRAAAGKRDRPLVAEGGAGMAERVRSPQRRPERVRTDGQTRQVGNDGAARRPTPPHAPRRLGCGSGSPRDVTCAWPAGGTTREEKGGEEGGRLVDQGAAKDVLEGERLLRGLWKRKAPASGNTKECLSSQPPSPPPPPPPRKEWESPTVRHAPSQTTFPSAGAKRGPPYWAGRGGGGGGAGLVLKAR